MYMAARYVAHIMANAISSMMFMSRTFEFRFWKRDWSDTQDFRVWFGSATHVQFQDFRVLGGQDSLVKYFAGRQLHFKVQDREVVPGVTVVRVAVCGGDGVLIV